MTKYSLFVDNVGRLIYGMLESENEEFLSVKAPVSLEFAPNGDKQLGIRMWPLIFPEVCENKDELAVFHFRKSQITLSNVEALNANTTALYERFIGLTPVENEGTEVVQDGEAKDVVEFNV